MSTPVSKTNFSPFGPAVWPTGGSIFMNVLCIIITLLLLLLCIDRTYIDILKYPKRFKENPQKILINHQIIILKNA